jgi:hypothetical protein
LERLRPDLPWRMKKPWLHSIRSQAAVKNNDVVTIDRILADDFVLVTGLGKTYSKRDLLEEARSKRMQYERQ